MKKIIFLCVAFTIITSLLPAQQNKLNIGIIGGASRGFLYGNELVKSSQSLISFSAGMIIQYNFPKILSLVSGLSYDIKGRQYSGVATDAYGNLTGRFKLTSAFNYVSVPLMLKATFGKKVGFFVEGGGFAAYLAHASASISGIPVNYSNNDITSYYKRLDAGLAFGIGISIPLSKHIALSLEGRNSLGLLHINTLPVYNGGSIKTNSTNLLLSLTYKLGERGA